MATSYKDYQAQISELQVQAEEQRKLELGGAIEQIRMLIKEFGLTDSDIAKLFKGSKGGGVRSKVAPKYADPATGATWSGRGLPPKWIAAAHKAGNHAKFLIDQSGGQAETASTKRAREAPVKKSRRGD